MISSAPRSRSRARKASAPNSVFINCPFDSGYQPLFRAVVFTVILCGFSPRCSLEIDDGSEVRIDKIVRIIGECRLGVHDLSRTELDAVNGLPRFNMPLELGLFLGAKRFGGEAHGRKNCLILDLEQYRYQKFISDLAGQDIRAHGGQINRIITAVRDWLRTTSGRKDIPGGGEIAARFAEFLLNSPISAPASL